MVLVCWVRVLVVETSVWWLAVFVGLNESSEMMIARYRLMSLILWTTAVAECFCAAPQEEQRRVDEHFRRGWMAQ